jgi:hypothetical protein
MALAAAQAARGDEADARAAWARAHELADACGADGLAQNAARALDETRAAR